MADEIAAVKRGRMGGTFLHARVLECHGCFLAVLDLLAEDWRSSGANSSVGVPDSPVYHDITAFVLQLWGPDHESAYRQFPVAEPNVTWVMHTPSGPTLLAAFEWTQAMGSAFLGVKFKVSKAQPPAGQHKLLGVSLCLEHDRAVVECTEERRQRLDSMLPQVLFDNLSRLGYRIGFDSSVQLGLGHAVLVGRTLRVFLVPVCFPSSESCTKAPSRKCRKGCSCAAVVEGLSPSPGLGFPPVLVPLLRADCSQPWAECSANCSIWCYVGGFLEPRKLVMMKTQRGLAPSLPLRARLPRQQLWPRPKRLLLLNKCGMKHYWSS